MELEEFVKELRRLRRKLNMYRDLYSQNEAAVKLQIINPLLRMLGWDLEDPKQVIPEFPFKGRKRKKPGRIERAIIEVKALGKADKGIGQAFEYAKDIGVKYIIITDGDKWRLYDTSRPITEALIGEWSLLKDRLKSVALKTQIIANTKNFGTREALTIEIRLRREH